jgi:hypothetical protein
MTLASRHCVGLDGLDFDGIPWLSPSATGWAVRQLTASSAVPHCECGQALMACDGCGDNRCIVCDPYRSDDCRWSI